MSKYIKVVTPVGIAKACFINIPSTTFDERGTYNIALSIPKADAKDLMNILDTAVQASYDCAVEDAKPAIKKQITKVPAYEPEFDDNGDETDNIIVKAKQIASFQYDGETIQRSISKYDSKGNKCDDMEVGSGSTVSMAFDLNSYYVAGQKTAGVSKYLTAVKIFDLVEFGDEDPFADMDNSTAGSFEAPKSIGEVKTLLRDEKLNSILENPKPIPTSDDSDVLDALKDL